MPDSPDRLRPIGKQTEARTESSKQPLYKKKKKLFLFDSGISNSFESAYRFAITCYLQQQLLMQRVVRLFTLTRTCREHPGKETHKVSFQGSQFHPTEHSQRKQQVFEVSNEGCLSKTRALHSLRPFRATGGSRVANSTQRKNGNYQQFPSSSTQRSKPLSDTTRAMRTPKCDSIHCAVVHEFPRFNKRCCCTSRIAPN